MTVSILWFRRDLRLADHPALLAARDAADEVLPLFVLDDALRGPSGEARLAFLSGCLRELHEATDGRLVVLHGDPVEVVPRLAARVGAAGVHVSADYGPYGAGRDRRVEKALGETPLVRTGSPYAIGPGTLHTGGGGSFKVYTPFYRSWKAHGVHAPALTPRVVAWTSGDVHSVEIPKVPAPQGVSLPEPGERAALARWHDFDPTPYDERRDTPGVAGTSGLSAYLKYGCVHPRSLLAGLGSSTGEETFRGELAWRDFYADVLWSRPEVARDNVQRQFDGMRWDSPGEQLTAWEQGMTGFPIVDAGMRQLLASGWMHNRVRMIVGSFLVKDLHLDWRLGARHFLRHLVDGDLASNNMGWQWVAGTGTDASPFFRVFNPTTQAKKFDPDGTYVRQWVPELRDVDTRQVHEPWTLPDGPPGGYPAPIVDHAAERIEALARYQEVKDGPDGTGGAA